ncbi:type I-E CRISPR-associated protein Cas6/Cse3/CasE [Thermochromatium tepidum]|uniref:Type I-E CRISPR-associated protein Cas6/Cse3/CasE n=1 Tax=Thermochromatium tepidum ATCC 43061 TaxID=316276 RepID=A0A6I6E0K5_THETI|nr:type I-E CRISPR-associated protein Cas6/Cse3/CasE [Thermochromatium tepidum]QGU33451.1 type I-E CRISPR-associated protein Cas6/Cse3/CasE [Thermochromatium tepidum ATCC 43061]
MSALHLLRLPIDPPRLLRFAFEHGIREEDETLGYTLHAWLAALFGEAAPKPFRYFESRREVLAYAPHDAPTLLDRAERCGSLAALAALDRANVASKPMPEDWRLGQRLHLEVLACPVSRRDDEEKDVFLRALDRQGDAVPPRGEVYRRWFLRQWQGTVEFEHLELLGMRACVPLLRRDRNGANRLKRIERPLALFAGEGMIRDPGGFAALLTRGIGRHRAFGFGMILLGPPR